MNEGHTAALLYSLGSCVSNIQTRTFFFLKRVVGTESLHANYAYDPCCSVRLQSLPYLTAVNGFLQGLLHIRESAPNCQFSSQTSALMTEILMFA